jgi:hypothetical protein
MNFSVDVNMYSEKVTSYWYRLRWNHRSSAAGYNMTPMSRNEAQARRQRVAKDVESIMNAWGRGICVVRGVVCCGVMGRRCALLRDAVFRDAVTFRQGRDHG